MESLLEEEEESQFFDAHEEITTSCSSVDYDGFQPLVSGRFQYDVWIKSPVNPVERRQKFLNWMGLTTTTSTTVVSETERSGNNNVDRFSTSVNGSSAVLRTLKSSSDDDDEFSSCRCDSSVFSSSESVDRVVNETLCKAEEEQEEVDSGMVLRNLDVDDNDISSSLCSGSSGLSGRNRVCFGISKV